MPINLGRGFNLPRILGIEVRIDYSWFIVFGLLLWTLADGYYPQTFPGQGHLTYWAMAVVSALLLFASVLAHELSHAVMARRHGLPVPRITLFIFGGVAQLGREPPGPRAELLIAGVGPLTSVVLGAVFLVLAELLHAHADIVSHTLIYLGIANIILALFNLLPGFPLDGGRVLRAWLWQRWANLRRATRAAARVGRLTGMALIVFGFLQIFQVLPGSLLGGMWMVFIGLFLQQAASSSYEITALEDVLRDVTVGEIMRENPVSVPEDLPLDRLVEDYLYRYRFASFPVECEARLTGLVHINQIKDIPREEWPVRVVGDVMSPLEAILVVSPEESAVEAFRQMTQSGAHKVPVARSGQLVGIITARDILQLFRIRSDLLD